jgi:hypothetical protein
MKHILDAAFIGIAFFFAGYSVRASLELRRIRRLQKSWRQWMKFHPEPNYARRERK